MRYKQSVRFQEEDHDGRRSLHLPHRSRQCPSSVLRDQQLNENSRYGKRGRIE